jgi:hypothetical protein
VYFYLHFPHFLSDLGAIRYKRSAYNDVDYLDVSYKPAHGRPHILIGIKETTFRPTP